MQSWTGQHYLLIFGHVTYPLWFQNAYLRVKVLVRLFIGRNQWNTKEENYPRERSHDLRMGKRTRNSIDSLVQKYEQRLVPEREIQTQVMKYAIFRWIIVLIYLFYTNCLLHTEKLQIWNKKLKTTILVIQANFTNWNQSSFLFLIAFVAKNTLVYCPKVVALLGIFLGGSSKFSDNMACIQGRV